MIIGIDFDNTIADYDNLMFQAAVQCELVDRGIPKSKRTIRDAIRTLVDGETLWTNLQAIVYGFKMHEARIMDGVDRFFRTCNRHGIRLYIVSHKTEYATIGALRVNLRTVAFEWLECHGLCDQRILGLGKNDIFFEDTRQQKIERIKTLKITHFIDDLEETFNEPLFPSNVVKILFAPHNHVPRMDHAYSFASWNDITKHFFDPHGIVQSSVNNG
jgi:hypothetical protein